MKNPEIAKSIANIVIGLACLFMAVAIVLTGMYMVKRNQPTEYRVEVETGNGAINHIEHVQHISLRNGVVGISCTKESDTKSRTSFKNVKRVTIVKMADIVNPTNIGVSDE
jgi:hypothetical protein